MTVTEQDFLNMKKAVCLLLDHAVYDVEKDDATIAAVDFARNELRKHPNKNTIIAMNEVKT